MPSATMPPTTPEAPVNPALFTPIDLRALHLPNRIIVSPMGMYSATPSGHPTPFHLMHIGHLAFRGAALTIMEATAVHPFGRSSPADLGLWSDDHIASFKKVTDFVHEQEGERKIGIQLAHAGRKAGMMPIYPGKKTWIATEEEGGWEEQVVGASRVRYLENYVEPREMTGEDIRIVVKAFGDAADRAVKAGFGKLYPHSYPHKCRGGVLTT